MFQVDKAVLSVMTDEQMAKYITSYGDRVAVLSFCQRSQCTTDKETLLQNLRDKIGARKMKRRTSGALCCASGLFQTQGVGLAKERSKAPVKISRKIEIGWLHFNGEEYHQVRTRYGGGTRHPTVDKATTVSEILEMGKELFFPDGNSTKGAVEDFLFDVCDFKRNPIPLDETVGNLYEKTKMKLLRFYICTREETASTVQSSSELNECGERLVSEDFSVSIHERDLQLTDNGSQDSDDFIPYPEEPGDSSDSDTTEQVRVITVDN